MPAPSPYTEQPGGLTKRREPASRPASPVRTARRVPRSRPPPVPGTHAMALRRSSSDRARAASPTVSRLLATAVTDPSFESAAASALVAELLDFAAACRLDYTTALVAESASASRPSVGGECALGTDVLEDRQEEFEYLAVAVPRFASMLLAPKGDPDAPDIPTPRSYAKAITGPYSSQWQAAMDAEMASWKSTGTYIDEVPPPGANIVDGMWIFRVKRPPGSPPAFKARYVARGFSQRQGVDYFHTFSPAPKMTTLRASCNWHVTLRTTLAALGFAPSTADPSLFLRTDTSLPPFYVLLYVDDLVFATADTEALTLVKSELQKRHTCTDLGELSFSALASSSPLSSGHSLSGPPSDESVEPSGPYPELVGCLIHRKVHWDAAKRVLRYLCSTLGMGLVLGGRGPVVLTVASTHVTLFCIARLVPPRADRPTGRPSRRALVISSCVPSRPVTLTIVPRRVRFPTAPVLPRPVVPTRFAPLVVVPPRAHVSRRAPDVPRRSPGVSRRAVRRFLAARPTFPAAPPFVPPRTHSVPPVVVTPRALLQPVAPPFAARLPPLAAREPPYAPARRPADARPASRNPDGRRPPARATLLPVRRPVSSCTALPFPACSSSARAPPYLRATLLAAHHPALPAMSSLSVLTFDDEGRPIQFDTWLDDLQLYLLSDSRDIVSLFDHTSRASLAPPATADSVILSKWLTRDPAAHLAVRNHLRLTEHAHFGQHTTDKALYDVVVARYSSLATAALGRLILPYLFPELSVFASVEDLGCSPSPLAPSYAFAIAVDILGAEDVGAAFDLSGKRRNSKGKGGKGGGAGSGGGGGGGGSGGGGGGGGGGSGGSGGESAGFGGGGRGSSGGGDGGGGGNGGGRGGAVERGGSGSGQRQQQQRRSETPSPQQLQLLRSGVDIFALDYDAILAAMYALSVSVEGDCYLWVPPDPGIEAAALGASESALSGTAPAEALHTFMLDSGASHCFCRNITSLTPLPAPVPVRLADPSRGLVLARSSTILSCRAVPSGSLLGLHLPSFSTNLVSTAALQDAMVTTTNPGGQRVSICTCTRTGRHLAMFTRRPGSSLYTLTTTPPQVAASAQAPPTWSPLPATPSWHALPPPYFWSSHVSNSPPALACPPCLPCVKGRQRAAPHSSSFPPTTAPLQTLCMDVWGPARVRGQDRESYFLPVVDDYTRYTTVFPLRSKGEFPDVLIPWIRAVRLQLRERFREDLPVLCLHSNPGGELSSDLLRDFCRGEGILYSTSGLVSPCRRPRLHCVGQGRLAMRRYSGSGSLVPLSAIPPLTSFPPALFSAPGWQFYHPTSHRVLPSQDVMFDELIPFYTFYYCTAPLQPLALFFAPGPPPVDPLPAQSPAPSGLSYVDPLLGTVPVKVIVELGAFRSAASGGAASGGAEPAHAEPGGAEPEGAEPGGAESEGAESGGAKPVGVELGGIEPEGVGPVGAEPEGAKSGDAERRGTAYAGGPAGASPRLFPRREPLSPQQLREWFAQRTRLRSGAVGVGGSATGGPGVGGAAAVSLGGTGGAKAACPRGARTRGIGVAGAGGVGGNGAGDPGAEDPGARGTDTGAGGAGAGGARAGDSGAGGTGAEGAGAGGAGAGGTGGGDPGVGGAGTGGAGARSTGAGGTVQQRPFFVPSPPWSLSPPDLVLSLPSSTGLPPSLLSPPPRQSQPLLQPDFPLPAPSP
ncbi:unnamed protein product [Closterium sp. NIES-54]